MRFTNWGFSKKILLLWLYNYYWFIYFRAQKKFKADLKEILISDGEDLKLVDDVLYEEKKPSQSRGDDDIPQLLKNIRKMVRKIPENSPFRTTLQRELFQGKFYF